LNKLKLPADMRADKREHQPRPRRRHEYSFRQRRTVCGSASDHSVQANQTGDFGIAWIGAPHVSHRRL
jgi:hypothetical protein